MFAVRSQDLIGCHCQVEVIRKPHFVHDIYDLEGEDILPQIVSVLKKELKLFPSGLLIESPKAKRDFFGPEDCAKIVPEISNNNFGVDR